MRVMLTRQQLFDGELFHYVPLFRKFPVHPTEMNCPSTFLINGPQFFIQSELPIECALRRYEIAMQAYEHVCAGVLNQADWAALCRPAS